MKRTIGCIGCGNMGGALMGGFASSLAGEDFAFCGYSRTMAKVERLVGVTALPDAAAVAKTADIVILAVKPYQMQDVLSTISPQLTSGKVLVSVAAGIGLDRLRSWSGGLCAVVRCMPDTPALVGKGVFAFAFGDMPEAGKKEIMRIFASLGLCLELPEAQFAAFSALIGAGPAYVFAMMQGLVQAGVTLGFGHDVSRQMVAALFEGCAVMALKNSAHLMELRDAVCSPAGLTIAGVNHLDRQSLAGTLVDAVLAAAQRGREMEAGK